ncbi:MULTISPECIES: MBL fold metallo-hydrolase [unclassified Microbacterium]|uniref:MBL fold metallo-hydrolase n=1 Tax=unclassified Microbacterium TaxID=2609290 RepID=UPI00214C53E0|nr:MULTISPECIES: MBL fold metallo-hydrolase [unclassified Microbacterium]MCR2808652.1 MBL fold metallo-hydrolase [Microbacterium sp. zg.B185]WIM18915.1 MBL fold metallo-hydrolase [Microbacterium sp. zg-B185]
MTNQNHEPANGGAAAGLDEAERWSALTTRILAPNAGLMTLDGTNTFVIRAEDAGSAVVVDPGPDTAAHLDRLEAFGPISLVLLTHHHFDHIEGAAEFAERTGAVVRALDPALCIDAPALYDGEVMEAAGTRIVVVATPGHTADSVCFLLPDDIVAGTDGTGGTLLTGDTILGRGTTILARPDGSLRDYLGSLARLRDLAGVDLVLPGHGPALPSLPAVVDSYLEHRRERLAQVSAALRTLDLQPSSDPEVVTRVTDFVYPHTHPGVRFAAEASTYAQLAFLETER